MIRRSVFLSSAIAGFLFAACSNEDGPVVSTDEIQLQIAVSDWDNANSRSTEEMLFPVQLLLVPSNSSTICKVITVTSDNQFSISVPNGVGEIYAVCGLSADEIPQKLTDPIAVPDAQSGVGKVDFCVGKASVPNLSDSGTSATLSITATHQVAWLDLQVSKVPSSVQAIKVYVQKLYDKYTLQEPGWKLSSAAANRYTAIPLSKNELDPTLYECSCYLPCSGTAGLNMVVEVTTTDGHKSFYGHTSSCSLQAGTHLAQQLEYTQLDVSVELTTESWTDANDEGTLSDTFSFAVGSQYFSYPATVFFNGEGALNVFPHAPITVTLSEARSWINSGTVEYDELPDLQVTRWEFPLSPKASNNILAMINTLTWEDFNSQFTASGNNPIDTSATNVLAWYDQTNNVFYRYDFQNMNVISVPSNSTDEFLFYPVGVIEYGY